MNEPSETDKAYLAGILDSDGSICLATDNKGRNTYRPLLAITNRSLPMLTWVKETFAVGWASACPYQPRCKVIRTFQVGSKERVGALLEMALPYLKGKKRQAELLLEFCRDHEYNTYTERDREIFRELKVLNHKGPDEEQVKERTK